MYLHFPSFVFGFDNSGVSGGVVVMAGGFPVRGCAVKFVKAQYLPS